ncbi:MAG TPA: glycosyltransferase, partial [Pseudonocardiaceae bacterium]|nr:glycosyltransferase [Pseudonocardiaceae bacterium]
MLPSALRGRLRGLLEAAPFATLPRPDLIWTSALEVAAPYAWAQAGALRRPLVLDLDATGAQLETIAPIYFNRPPRRGVHRAVARSMEYLIWRGTSLFTPWSNWAADGLRRCGIPSERIRVLPPGVDLKLWQPAPRS